MNNENKSEKDLLEEIEVLKEQNKKLEITSSFYKMLYEDDMEALKNKSNKMFNEISNIGTFKYHYKYKMVSVTTDAVVFGFDNKKKKLMLLLIQRGCDPKEYDGYWALPGGFLQQKDEDKKSDGEKDETVDECALRELNEETSFNKLVRLEQFHVYSDSDRDSRGRIITVAYLALVMLNKDDNDTDNVKGGTDAKEARWFPVDELPEKIAFDHRKIISDARKELKRNIFFKPVVYDLLDETFTLPEVQNLYEIILETEFDRRNFQKKIKTPGFIIDVNDNPDDEEHRGSKRYTFDKEAYKEFKENGFKLEF